MLMKVCVVLEEKAEVVKVARLQYVIVQLYKEARADFVIDIIVCVLKCSGQKLCRMMLKYVDAGEDAQAYRRASDQRRM